MLRLVDRLAVGEAAKAPADRGVSSVQPRWTEVLNERSGAAVSIDDGLGKGLRCFLRQVVTDAAGDQAMVVAAGELLGVGAGIGCGAPLASPSIVIVGTVMSGVAASFFSISSYFASPSARPSRQR